MALHQTSIRTSDLFIKGITEQGFRPYNRGNRCFMTKEQRNSKNWLCHELPCCEKKVDEMF